jgi:hypothetical protein
MKPNRIRSAIVALAATLGAGAALGAYPEQPIKLIVPFPAAGSTDLVARTLAVDLGTALGQQIVVENKAGAGSLIGSEFVAKAAAGRLHPPDGGADERVPALRAQGPQVEPGGRLRAASAWWRTCPT